VPVRRTFRLDAEVDQRLEKYIESTNLSRSEVIRKALEAYLESRANKGESEAHRLLPESD